jgi:uncharacterized protein YjbI with pentapeptide repeats
MATPLQYRHLAPEELAQVLAKHELYLSGDEHGEHANLSNADLTGANLSGRRLSNANLKDANLTGADLTGCDLQYSSLQGARIVPEQVFSATNWLLAFWDKETLEAIRIPADHNSRLRGHRIEPSLTEFEYPQPGPSRRVGERNFEGYDLSGRDLGAAYLTEANLKGADVRGADLRKAILKFTQVLGMKNWLLAKLSGDMLRYLRLPPDHNDRIDTKNFEFYDLEGRTLSLCDLSKANLRGAKLAKAIVKELDLRGTDLTGADVRDVDFREAKIDSGQV